MKQREVMKTKLNWQKHSQVCKPRQAAASPASWRADLPSHERRLCTGWWRCPWRQGPSSLLGPPSECTRLSDTLKRDVCFSVCFTIRVNTVKERGGEKRSKPGRRFLKPVPSCFLMLSNTTVLAGMFTPMAKVSVANSTWRTGRCTFGRF